MNHNKLLIAIRQVCDNGVLKLDTMVKPDVVVKEARESFANLKEHIDQARVSYAEKAKLYEILRQANSFIAQHKRDGEALRNKLKRIKANLPPAKM